MRLRNSTCPAASAPCTWNTCFAMSRPIVVACSMDASFGGSSTPSPWHTDAVGGRPPHHPTQPVAVPPPDDGIGGARGWRGAEPERPVSDRSADLCCGIGGGGSAPKPDFPGRAREPRGSLRLIRCLPVTCQCGAVREQASDKP